MTVRYDRRKAEPGRLEAIEALAADAAAMGASDVHLDLDADDLRVRMRIGGHLRAWDVAQGGPAGLRAAAWRVIDMDDAALSDWRIAAHADGDRLAVRLHAAANRELTAGLRTLGMSAAQAGVLARADDQPGGVIVVAGAAGSGRRTTIATLLERSMGQGASIVAVGMALPQVLTVTRGPANAVAPAIERALTLDPDILVLGELGDRASADLAFRFAASGRRVILRLAAPDTVAAIVRLRELQVDSYALAAQVRAVTAQRLAERLCPACRRPVQATGKVAALLGFDPGAVVYRSPGCASCLDTGTSGAVGVFEVIETDRSVAQLVNNGADAVLLARHVFVNTPRLDSAARTMVREGVIPAEEALRLSRAEPLPVRAVPR